MGCIYDKIYPIGDMHLGADNCNEKIFKETIEKIYNEDNSYILGMGDYCEIGSKTSFGTFKQTIQANEQIKKFMEYFRPFVEESRVLGLLQGNHENRISRDTGFDLTKTISRFFEIPYYGLISPLSVKAGRFRYNFYAGHPKSSATTISGRDRIFNRMRNIILNADVYLVGHLHSLQKEKKIGYIYFGKDRLLVEQHFICTGSFLDYVGSYAEEKLYEPQELGCYEIRLYRNKHKVEVVKYEG